MAVRKLLQSVFSRRSLGGFALGRGGFEIALRFQIRLHADVDDDAGDYRFRISPFRLAIEEVGVDDMRILRRL